MIGCRFAAGHAAATAALVVAVAFGMAGCTAVAPPPEAVDAGGGSPDSGAPLSPGSRLPCEVERIVDGDTFRCVGNPSAVRLLLVDTPEMDQEPFGVAARDALAALLPIGSAVTLEIDVDPTDPYDRLLAYAVLPNGRIANEELLRSGFAVVAVYPPNVRHVDRFRAVLEGARAGRRGLWAVDAFSCLPADHRAGRC